MIKLVLYSIIWCVKIVTNFDFNSIILEKGGFVVVSNAFVVLMGIGTVFIGLICIVFLCMAMSAIVRKFEKPEAKTAQPAAAEPAGTMGPIPNRGELVAAISAALAEELGTDIAGFRIVSLKRLSPGGEPSRGELVAAISAALAEDLGTDVAGLRITSLKQVSK